MALWFRNRPHTADSILTGYLYGARSRRRSIPIPIGIANEHALVLGESGFGKSAFLYGTVVPEILRGWSVVVLDHHGDLFERLTRCLAQAIYGAGRADLLPRVFLLDPTDRRYGSPGLNVLEVPHGVEPYEVVDELVSDFKAIWRDAWGDRMADILRNAFRAAIEAGLTLAEVPQLLTDPLFRTGVVLPRVRDTDVRLFWEQHFGAFTAAEQRYFVESARNKLSAFLSNPYLQPILSQTRSTVDFPTFLQSGGILMVNLARSRLKAESRRLFGALLMGKILTAILARQTIPEDERHPTRIHDDEMHESYNPESVTALYTAGRKFHCGLWGYSQSLSQYPPADVDVILGSTATQVCFNLAWKDGERMAKEFFQFTGRAVKYVERDIWGPRGKPTFYSVQEELEHAITELTTQAQRECYIRFKGNDVPSSPYIAKVSSVIYADANADYETALREASAARFAKTSAAIVADRAARLASLGVGSTAGGVTMERSHDPYAVTNTAPRRRAKPANDTDADLPRPPRIGGLSRPSLRRDATPSRDAHSEPISDDAEATPPVAKVGTSRVADQAGTAHRTPKAGSVSPHRKRSPPRSS